MSLSNAQIHEYRRLKDSGVDVSDSNCIRFSKGQETSLHVTVKSLAGLVALQNNYRVDSEVKVENQVAQNGTVDVLMWGNDDRLTYAVEVDTSLTPEKKQRKQEKYVDYTHIDDIQFLDLNNCPREIVECYGWIGSKLGLPV